MNGIRPSTTWPRPLDQILNTDYAAKPQRLRTILKRLADVPAYYQAAQARS
jgi:hypothetical protein